MHDSYINLILVLATGRVWSEKAIATLNCKSIDMWDCEPWMEFIRMNFMPSVTQYIKQNKEWRYKKHL